RIKGNFPPRIPAVPGAISTGSPWSRERNVRFPYMKRYWRTSLLVSASCAALTLAVSGASANDKLVELSKSEQNWIMTGKNYHANNYSPNTQINTENVKRLRQAWSFSTGVLHGHEGTPLVVDGLMYVHTSFPNN